MEEFQELNTIDSLRRIRKYVRLFKVIRSDIDDHCTRVGIMACCMMEYIGAEEYSQIAYIAGKLHDVGKADIPDEVLYKIGPLTEDEHALLRSHVILSTERLKEIELDKCLIGRIVAEHHENFDGTGYPKGLKGFQISVIARVIRICDSYDAMREYRPYSLQRSHEEALDELIRRNKDSEIYDPKLLETFLKNADRIVETVKESMKLRYIKKGLNLISPYHPTAREEYFIIVPNLQ